MGSDGRGVRGGNDRRHGDRAGGGFAAPAERGQRGCGRAHGFRGARGSGGRTGSAETDATETDAEETALPTAEPTAAPTAAPDFSDGAAGDSGATVRVQAFMDGNNNGECGPNEQGAADIALYIIAEDGLVVGCREQSAT